MRVWEKASGAIKDRNSIWVAKFSRKGPFHNPDLETVIIKATSHDNHHIDMKNMQRVFQWLRTSPLYLKPLIWALSMRMQKTRSWVVALKGLMLIHGVFCCDIPAVQRMGRLPFDLSNFSDGHLSPAKAWSFNTFVRGYFAYLDQRSAFVSSEFKSKQKKNDKEVEVVETLMEELEKLQKLQGLIDMLLQIRPRNENLNIGLILEAMDCVIVEVFGVYSKFCNRIAKVLMRIYEVGGRVEASIGLKILQKAAIQGEELSLFFDFCKDIGVLNASQCPKVERISMEDIQDLERIISGTSTNKGNGVANDEDKAIVLRDCSSSLANFSPQKESENGLMTVITHQWEVFDDDVIMAGAKGMHCVSNGAKATGIATNPFVESYSIVPYIPAHTQPLPDLISF
ncbi:putative clathrin assembly protein At1g25240 [Cajanus cajan]|uniref:Clathrin assembly protein At1g25240 family n=1 Tax=Cajanus cajan TaxID=3821 RepID=A0A151T2I5_CAJCA|nr:putative clathrin assembly protein At1g25240 [Cajanus cajan]XP_029128508.1 putative clathrin assembly protein At1g25240 [Cajanus cajan]XP_029128509.1 putative clathrin assembly protein At1g25240 [Cajanus cajan]KYP61266.1 Putative clathrin assembly protein At1g25240 family [Cajanus cajan]